MSSTAPAAPALHRKIRDVDEARRLLGLIASVCDHFSEHTDVDQHLTVYHSCALPGMPIEQYLATIWERTRYGEAVLRMLLVLLSRYWAGSHGKNRYPPSSLAIHRLGLTAFIVASKLHEERVHSNGAMAHLAGLSASELQRLEIDFVASMKRELFVSAADADHIVSEMLAALDAEDPVADVCARLHWGTAATPINEIIQLGEYSSDSLDNSLV